MEIYPGVYHIKTPLPDNPLGFVNVYLLKTEQGNLLIDTGWGTDNAFDRLVQQMAEAGVALDELTYLVITHLHPDHFGLAGRIQEHSPAQIILHAAENAMLIHSAENMRSVFKELDRWLCTNGMPQEVRRQMGQAISSGSHFGNRFKPDWVISGGEHLQLGEFALEFIWTPGHSPGNLVIYESSQRLLFSGDHVLPNTTPNISMYSESMHNPLADYLESLSQTATLDAVLVLPGHGEPFTELADRVVAIQAHHEARLEEMYHALNQTYKTAYQVAAVIPWSLNLPWAEFPPLQQQFALTETIAHLELLVKRGKLRKSLKDGLVWYEQSELQKNE